jgi:hypothetical protein
MSGALAVKQHELLKGQSNEVIGTVIPVAETKYWLE